MTTHVVGPELFVVGPNGPALTAAFGAERSVHGALDDLPLGVYTTLRTFAHERFVGLDAHLARLDQSLRLAGLAPPRELSQVRQALQSLASDSPHADSLLRIDVLAQPCGVAGGRLAITRGVARPVDARWVKEGVGVGVAEGLVRATPLIKSARFAIERRPLPLGTAEEYEHLLLDAEGRVLEGSSSNTFCVLDGELCTAADGMLEGVTRRLVLELARGLALPVRFERVPLRVFEGSSEAFLTSSSRGLVPIVRVRQTALGSVRPGPLTRALQAEYARLVERAAPAL